MKKNAGTARTITSAADDTHLLRRSWVLGSMEPDERLTFVSHDMFAVPFVVLLTNQILSLGYSSARAPVLPSGDPPPGRASNAVPHFRSIGGQTHSATTATQPDSASRARRLFGRISGQCDSM